jgi:predicted homoserine dehydrogenase-like protein
MIIVDRALAEREGNGRPIRAGMIGAGFMGHAVARQIIRYTPGMRLAAIANRHVDKAVSAYEDSAAPRPVIVHNTVQLDSAIRSELPAVCNDPSVLSECNEIDAIIEITGTVEFAARAVLRAIESHKHVVLMNAELDATVGPVLQNYAKKAGVVLTACDGDQPAVLVNLHRFVTGMGLSPLVCGNVKGFHDPYRTPATQAEFAARWGQSATMVTSFADGTKVSFEQAVVANATGMRVERRGMGGRLFDGHVDDLVAEYDAGQLKAGGGVVDYVVGARPAPGVFVLASVEDERQRMFLDLYKLGKGPLYSFYSPYHLCHFEAPTSIARAVIFGDAAAIPLSGPQVGVIAAAKRDLKAGETLDGIGGFMTYGLAENHHAIVVENLLPMGLAEGCVLKRDIRRDSVLSFGDVALPGGRLCDRLWQEQLEAFPAGPLREKGPETSK